MTDLVGDPALEIPIPPPTPSQLAEALWNAQGGAGLTFAFMNERGDFVKRTVADYAYMDKAYTEKVRQIQELDNWLQNAVGEYDVDMLQEIADIFGIMLERSWTFDVTVRFTGTFTCPPDVDPETVVDNFTFSLDESYYLPDGTSIDDSDYQVESSDWSEA